jgi:hypothetical protein
VIQVTKDLLVARVQQDLKDLQDLQDLRARLYVIHF